MDYRRIAVSAAQEAVPWNRFPRSDLLSEEDENQTTGGFAVSYPCSRLAGMSWTRGLLAALAVCVVLVTGSVSCGTSGEQGQGDGQSVSPVGKVLGDTDDEGRHYREVDKKNAPEVGIEVQPATDDCWSVRLTVENFTFSPDSTKAEAVSGRGVAVLFVDDLPVTTLRTPAYRLAAAYVPQGTHKVTARLYADDGTVWAVDGDPVESTADVTASEPQASTSTGTGTPSAESTADTEGTDSETQSAPNAGGDDFGPASGASAEAGTSGTRFATVSGGAGSGVVSAGHFGRGDSGVALAGLSGRAGVEVGMAGFSGPSGVDATSAGLSGPGGAGAAFAGLSGSGALGAAFARLFGGDSGTASAVIPAGSGSGAKITRPAAGPGAAADDASAGARLTASTPAGTHLTARTPAGAHATSITASTRHRAHATQISANTGAHA